MLLCFRDKELNIALTPTPNLISIAKGTEEVFNQWQDTWGATCSEAHGIGTKSEEVYSNAR